MHRTSATSLNETLWWLADLAEGLAGLAGFLLLRAACLGGAVTLHGSSEQESCSELSARLSGLSSKLFRSVNGLEMGSDRPERVDPADRLGAWGTRSGSGQVRGSRDICLLQAASCAAQESDV